ncbi:MULTISPECIES: N-acetyltransferase [Ralstonia solanacearum species complex]|uniref:N-acetyltransferase domain-containing protein n=1 Tax=Ralstonia solanacearum IPO1609 TaxID=564066 RepID=A0A7U7JD23_RALSL|nr:N-acetyltransferase [Ralstonia solanacearum]MDN4064698.1 N-acetyltransferase [Ralstonia solanacearum]CEJ16650.1 conserved hypothetical protein [Ralstonia solanacearum IPO1609]
MLTEFNFLTLRSFDDEAAFFALLGRFFASPGVRRECGGYPLNDGPRYRWFVAQCRRDRRALAFISVEEQAGLVRIRNGYVRPEARGRGLFRELRRRVLAHIEQREVTAVACLPATAAECLRPHGFIVRGTHGRWVTLEKAPHGTSRSAAASGDALPRTRRPAASGEGGHAQCAAPDAACAQPIPR